MGPLALATVRKNPFFYTLQHPDQIVFYFRVPEAQETDSQRFKRVLSTVVLALLAVMTASVHFYGQT